MDTVTSTELTAIKNLKQITREECIAPGTSVCGGCGGLEALRLAAKVLGTQTVFVNAAGCFTLLATFPYTPFKSSWLYTSMASAAAGAQGIRDALDVLMARGKMAPTDDVQVVVVAGDGSTYDMGLAATSGALFRGLDLLFIAHAPCPTGWLYDPERTAEYARLAVETGIFALKEAVDGAVTHTYKPRRRRPVEDYLRGQGRYRHLFEPEPDTTALGHIQRQLDEYWAAVS